MGGTQYLHKLSRQTHWSCRKLSALNIELPVNWVLTVYL